MKSALYTMRNTDYYNYLQQYDKKIPYISSDKERHPFVGIVLQINGYSYYAPFTSPKPKHYSMNERIDFIKIKNGMFGAINLNNMVPIHSQCVERINFKELPDVTAEQSAYKKLCINQVHWCQSNIEAIMKKARKLYHLVTEGNNPGLASRCCDFKLDERLYLEYCQNNGLLTDDLCMIQQ